MPWSTLFGAAIIPAIFRRVSAFILTVAGACLLWRGSPVQAQLSAKQIPAYIPKLTTHASPFAAYAIAFLALVGVTVVMFRSAHRGTRSGGREK